MIWRVVEELDGETIPADQIEELWICSSLDRCTWHPPAAFDHLAPYTALEAEDCEDAARMLETREHFGAWALHNDGAGARWFPVTIEEVAA